MKKLCLVAIIAIFGLANVNAQGFSAKAGFNSITLKNSGFSATESGFYVGVGYAFEVSEEINIEPAVLYSAVSNLNSIYVPIMVQYSVSEDFYIQAGPQVNYLLEDIPSGEFGLDIAAGAGYNISEEFYVEARYGFQVSRDWGNTDLNTLSVGVGYRF